MAKTISELADELIVQMNVQPMYRSQVRDSLVQSLYEEHRLKQIREGKLTVRSLGINSWAWCIKES